MARSVPTLLCATLSASLALSSMLIHATNGMNMEGYGPIAMAMSEAQFVDLVTTRTIGEASGSLLTGFGALFHLSSHRTAS